eukprot:6196775-Pleurochrysis_carterae.AAC.1
MVRARDGSCVHVALTGAGPHWRAGHIMRLPKCCANHGFDEMLGELRVTRSAFAPLTTCHDPVTIRRKALPLKASRRQIVHYAAYRPYDLLRWKFDQFAWRLFDEIEHLESIGFERTFVTERGECGCCDLALAPRWVPS